MALVNNFGPGYWAKCVAGQVSISALAARGDKMDANFVETNEGLGNILGSMRQYMLANGTPQTSLDQLVRSSAAQITTGDQAAKIAVDCIDQIGTFIQKN